MFCCHWPRVGVAILLPCVLGVQQQQPPASGYTDDGRGSEVPVYVDVHSHPKTGFSCEGKQAGNYYADPATNCAVYYICLVNEYNRLSATSFACPNGTLFNQATRVCSPHDQVYCALSTRYYDSVQGKYI